MLRKTQNSKCNENTQNFCVENTHKIKMLNPEQNKNAKIIKKPIDNVRMIMYIVLNTNNKTLTVRRKQHETNYDKSLGN